MDILEAGKKDEFPYKKRASILESGPPIKQGVQIAATLIKSGYWGAWLLGRCGCDPIVDDY